MATEKRLIDANALMESIYDTEYSICCPLDEVSGVINDAPTVDAVPVVHGEWQFGELDFLGASVKCSNCGWGVDKADPVLWVEYPGHKFCGNCGADMRGGDVDA